MINLHDHLQTELTVPASGHFRWDINPSTRPAVAKQTGRLPHGDPSPPRQFSGGATTATPCANFDTTDPSCWNDHPFVVPAGAGIDNAKATVRIEWTSPASDWDLKVFRDSNGDGSSQGETGLVGSSAGGVPANSEESTFVEPKLVPGRRYVARVQNFAAADPYQGTITFQGPDPLVRAQVERWTLICESPTGSDERRFVINRGESRHLDLRAACSS